VVIQKNSTDAMIVDLRKPCTPYIALEHNTQVNCAAWYPNCNVLSTASDNAYAYIWDLAEKQESQQASK
jgi:WD40 repeat protein